MPSKISRGSGPAPHLRRPTGRSGAFLKALTDNDSVLARFLLRGGRGGDGSNWLTGSCHGGDDDDGNGGDMPGRMGGTEATFCALALEPMDARNERVIRAFEAYAIFGSLFLGAVWIIYEWGSPRGDFGNEDINSAVARAFECLMAVALGCNVMLALCGATWWIMSITHNSSHDDFALAAMRPLRFLDFVLVATQNFVLFGLLLGICSNLSPNLPETIVAIAIVAALFIACIAITSEFIWATIPLEIYHWHLARRLILPWYWRKRGRTDLRARAQQRARELTERARRERKRLDPAFKAKDCHIGPVGTLLAKAAANLGTTDCDISDFEARLKEDWFSEVDHLKGRTVECLSGYMPLRLAEEVHRLCELGGSSCKGVRI